MDDDGEGSVSYMLNSYQAFDNAAANGSMSIDSIMSTQLLVPVAVPKSDGHDGQLAIVSGEAGQEKKDAVSKAVNDAAGQNRSSGQEHRQDAVAYGGMTLDKQLPPPVDLFEGDVDHGRLGIVPGEAGQKRKRKEEVSEQVEHKPKRKNRVSWTEDEHRIFLLGLQRLKNCPTRWKTMSTYLLTNKSISEISSHAQKYFIWEEHNEERQRKSINSTILREEDKVRLMPWIEKRLLLFELSQAIPTVVQSHAGQFYHVPGSSFPGQEQNHFHQMPVMGARADSRPSFDANQMQPTPQRLDLSQAGSTVVHSHAGQFHQVPGGSYPRQEQLHQMLMMEASADPRLSFCEYGQTQMQLAPQLLELSQAAPNMVQSHASQFHQVTGGSYLGQEQLHQIPMMGASANPRPSFGKSGQPASQRLKLSQAASNVVQSHASQFHQVLEGSYLRQEQLHRIPMMGASADPRPSFGESGQRASRWLKLSQAAPNVVQSHASQFHQVSEGSYPGKVQLHKMPVMGTLADPRPSFDEGGQTRICSNVTWSMAPNRPDAHILEELFRSITGPAVPHPALVPTAPIQDRVKSIRQEFQPVPTVQPMVQPHLLNGASTLMPPLIDQHNIDATTISNAVIPISMVVEYQRVQPSFYDNQCMPSFSTQPMPTALPRQSTGAYEKWPGFSTS
ncbi:hypothetical protein CRG98_011748 [Punica granatum]|uniref:Myb-like domain-containing protein n=1 Tax=Punica granatum TaxID=22663 RepID=A0A2I0KHB7_PUNGR|nr:hypothetical protein CRG98_011748 [Punica granatum]